MKGEDDGRDGGRRTKGDRMNGEMGVGNDQKGGGREREKREKEGEEGERGREREKREREGERGRRG